jgi:hypothetical protein
MSLGGIDLILRAPRGVPIADVVLRTCRRRWPNCVFQGEDEGGVHSVADPILWLDLTDSREFFVYRDRHAAERWDIQGYTPEDPNSMLYFIVADDEGSTARIRETTLVCGELTGEIRELVGELEEEFQFLASAPPCFKEAA